MKHPRFVFSLLLPALVFAGLPAAGASAQKEPPKGALAKIQTLSPGDGLWYAVDNVVGRELLQTDWELLEAHLKAAPPNLAVLLGRLDLALRRGHRGEAGKWLKQIAIRPDFAKLRLSDALSGTLVERKEWELGEDLLRLQPPKEVGTNYVLINHISQTRGAAAADQLLERLAADGNAAWTAQWVFFRSQHGGADSLLKKLEEAVRANPESLSRAMLYLRALRSADKIVNLDWMGEVCKPQRTLDSYALGGELLSQRAYKSAAMLLERSLATPVTKDELQQLSSTIQMLLPNLESHFRGWTRAALAEAYKGMGRADLAQQQVEELAKLEREAGGLTPRTALLAGGVQALSGQRQIEGSILQEEKPNENSPEYWLTRANYYVGRKEDQLVRQAFEKALALAPVGAEGTRTKGGTLRMQIIQGYANYLKSQRAEEAIQFLRKELGRPGQTDDDRSSLLARLLNYYREARRQVTADDTLLWKVLAEQVHWGYAEENGLRAMLVSIPEIKGTRELPSDGKLAVIERAEKLCRGTDPSRAKTLGWICTRYGYPERAVPLLRDAAARLSDAHERDSVQFTLFEAYLGMGNIANAERLLPGAIRYLTPEEAPNWISQVAVATAKSGDTARAMRLWRRVVNLDATFVLPVRILAASGMTESLQHFYRKMQKTDPDSWVPPAMLDHLSRPLTVGNWMEFEAN